MSKRFGNLGFKEKCFFTAWVFCFLRRHFSGGVMKIFISMGDKRNFWEGVRKIWGESKIFVGWKVVNYFKD